MLDVLQTVLLPQRRAFEVRGLQTWGADAGVSRGSRRSMLYAAPVPRLLHAPVTELASPIIGLMDPAEIGSGNAALRIVFCE